MTWQVTTGDCLAVLAAMDSATVDAIVTDPPYGLAFMGKDWDHAIPGEHFWVEALRVAKPGAHLVAFGGTRTHHRLMAAIEDAGWEIRDCLMWLYGSGFPKSHNGPWGGTALKPVWEPIVLVRKPLAGTVAANVERYGVGGLNVDGCRIPGRDVNPSIARRAGATNHLSTRPARETESEGRMAPRQSPESFRASRPGEALGRWPANVVLDEDAAVQLDAEAGETRPGHLPLTATSGPSRFYYTAKASRSEREAGLTGDERPLLWSAGAQNPGSFQSENTHRAARNHHPTVKPIALMRWLCRLVTPPNGLVLDPFAGSGSTGCAAALEGFRFHGIEVSDKYAAIARQRIAHWASLTTDQIALEFTE